MGVPMCKIDIRPNLALLLFLVIVASGCGPGPVTKGTETQKKAVPAEHRFVVLDPGHFHAALVFKKPSYQGVSSLVGIYAPVGEDFVDHMARVVPFNTRNEDPASWRYHICLGPNCQEKMLEEKFGDIAVLSGKNQPKIDRILACVRGGLNVLADKPWVIDSRKLAVLDTVITEARSRGLVIYDIMTERFEITTTVQRFIVNDEAVFGKVVPGSPDDPAVVKKSVHHLYKIVAGRPNKRPWWFFDTAVQGEGVVDVTTHLVDMVFWTLFPELPIDYRKDIEMVSASHWPTIISREEFGKVTGLAAFPSPFALDKEGRLPYYCNGRMNYRLKGVNVQTQVEWKFEAPEGSGDTHYSIIKGSKAHVLVLQGKEQNYLPEVYIIPAPGVQDIRAVEEPLKALIGRLASTDYPGISLSAEGNRWHIAIPDKYRVGHEAHFGQVADRFLSFLDGKPVPEWEYANLLAKYYVTTSALELAARNP